MPSAILLLSTLLLVVSESLHAPSIRFDFTGYVKYGESDSTSPNTPEPLPLPSATEQTVAVDLEARS